MKKRGSESNSEPRRADRARFELAEGVALTRFRGVLLRPLGHSSMYLPKQATCSLCHTVPTSQIRYVVFRMSLHRPCSGGEQRIVSAWVPQTERGDGMRGDEQGQLQ